MAENKQAQRILHGNRAKIGPKKDMAGLYESNRAAMPARGRHGIPVANGGDGACAGIFQEENKQYSHRRLPLGNLIRGNAADASKT